MRAVAPSDQKNLRLFVIPFFLRVLHSTLSSPSERRDLGGVGTVYGRTLTYTRLVSIPTCLWSVGNHRQGDVSFSGRDNAQHVPVSTLLAE